MKLVLRIFLLIVLLVVVAAGIYRWKQASSLEVVHPVRGVAVQAVYATGTVEASVMLPIASRASARLIALNVDEGSKVTKGQQLAQLEDEDLQHTIEELRARESRAREDYGRKAALLKQGFATRQAYEQSRSDLNAAVAATRKAEDQAGYLKLVAPADGVVIKRDGEIGQMIPMGQPVFWLSTQAPLRIAAEVDEEDIAQVKLKQAVLIRADAFPGQVFHGYVQAITPKGDPVARSYRVRVIFDNETPLQIGMTTEINIIAAERKDALLLPSSAVAQDKVWLIRDGKLLQQKVSVGARGPEKTEIQSGVLEADVVVLRPTSNLRAGARPRTILIDAPTS